MKENWLDNISEAQLKWEYGLIWKCINYGVKREKGYLYFIGKDGCLWASPMKHNPTGVKKKVGTYKTTAKDKEILDYVRSNFR